MGTETSRPCVFLDRDGTLVHDTGYVHRIEDLSILPGVAESLAALRRAGCLLIVVTNQSGVARGFYDEAAVEAFHVQLSAQLGAAAAPDAYYFCPFHPDAPLAHYRRDSELRKPNIGMLELACRAFPVARERSFMIGDKLLDMEFAQRAGLRGILLSSDSVPASGDYVIQPDFASAASCILALHERGEDAWSGG